MISMPDKNLKMKSSDTYRIPALLCEDKKIYPDSEKNENGFAFISLKESQKLDESNFDMSVNLDFKMEANCNATFRDQVDNDNSTDESDNGNNALSGDENNGVDEKQSLLNSDETEDHHISHREKGDKINVNGCVPPWRTCLALCLAFMFTYSAFEAIQNLQSSLNSEGHLGEWGLFTMYAAVMIGSILAPVGAKFVGHKGILCLGFLGHFCYTCTNVWPSFATLIPVSAAQGVLTGGIGMSQGVYITAISSSYIHYNILPQSKLYGVTSFFSGVFYCCFKGTQIAGNLLSSGIFQTTSYNTSILKDNRCGARVCTGFVDAPDFDRPSNGLIHSLLGSFALMNAIGLAIFVIGLPHLNNPKNEKTTFCKVIKSNTGGCLLTMVNPKFMAFTPFIIAESMIVMMSYSGFTKYFVSCAVGVQWVGYSMVALGVVSSFTALIANYLAQYTGRIAQFATGMSVDVATVVIMFLWEPDYTTDPLLLLIVPMMSGFSQGILQPQQQALLGSIFSKEEFPGVFSAAGAVKCMGFSIFLCITSTFCVYYALLLAAALYIPGIIGYIYIEVMEWRKDKK